MGLSVFGFASASCFSRSRSCGSSAVSGMIFASVLRLSLVVGSALLLTSMDFLSSSMVAEEPEASSIVSFWAISSFILGGVWVNTRERMCIYVGKVLCACT